MNKYTEYFTNIKNWLKTGEQKDTLKRKSAFVNQILQTHSKDDMLYFHLINRGFSYQNSPSILDTFLEIRERGFNLPNKNAVQVLEKIFTEGKIEDKKIPDYLPGRRNYLSEISIRRVSAELYVSNPDLIKKIVESNSVGGHGTQSGTLVDVLLHGLRPRKTLEQRNISVTTGEAFFGSQGLNQDYLSCAQWSDPETLQIYAEMNSGQISKEKILQDLDFLEERLDENEGNRMKGGISARIDSLKKTLAILESQPQSLLEAIKQHLTAQNFPIVYLFTTKDHSGKFNDLTRDGSIIIPQSDINSEFAVKDGVDPDQVTVVLVPKEQVNNVRKIIDAINPTLNTISIFPIEDFSRLELEYKVYHDVKLPSKTS